MRSYPEENLAERFACEERIHPLDKERLGSVGTKMMILPTPKRAYEQAKQHFIVGHDSRTGTSCGLPASFHWMHTPTKVFRLGPSDKGL